MAADYLRNNDPPTQSKLNDLEIMIRDSDNDAADRTYGAIGGTAGVQRMVSVCSLTDSKAAPRLWSSTAHVRPGRGAAGPVHRRRPRRRSEVDTVAARRDAQGPGRGRLRHPARRSRPPSSPQIAIKNGWLLSDDDNTWHTNCLAIGDTWVLGGAAAVPADRQLPGRLPAHRRRLPERDQAPACPRPPDTRSAQLPIRCAVFEPDTPQHVNSCAVLPASA